MIARVAWIVAVAQLTAVVAHADSTETAANRALAHLDRGVAAFRAGDFAGARAEIAEAQRLAPDRPNPYRWLALTEVELGDCRSALLHIEGFLSRVPADDPRVSEIIALRQRCTGTLRVASTPDGAAVHLDGGPAIATTPTPDLAIALGHHRLTLAKPGYLALEAQIDVRAMGAHDLRYALTVQPTARPLHRRWWFWAAAGAVAIAAAGTTYALTRDDDARLPAVTCDAIGCHP